MGREKRTKTWIKAKRFDVAMLQVIGYTTKSSSRHVASIILAEEGETLEYVGRAGTGLSLDETRALFEELSALEIIAGYGYRFKIELAFRQAIESYEVRPWAGPLTLPRPALDRHWQVSKGNWVSQEREYVFEDNDWTQWAPQLEVIEVPGDHDSMVLVPNVTTLAAALKPRLRLSQDTDAQAPVVARAAE